MTRRLSCFWWACTLGAAVALGMLLAARAIKRGGVPEPVEIERAPVRPAPAEPKEDL